VEVENTGGAGEGVAVDSSGNTFVTGFFSGSGSDFNPLGTSSSLASGLGGKDGVFAKYDSAGKLLWKRQFGSTTGDDGGNSIAVDTTGNIYVVGSFEDTAIFGAILWVPLGLVSAGGSDAFVAKYDSSGNMVWVRGLGGPGNDVAHDVAVDGNGNVYVTGYFTGTADFDPGSGTRNLVSRGSTDAFVCRLTSSGSLSWVTQIGGSSTDVGLGITLSGDRVAACGYHRSNPAWAEAFTIGNSGGSDGFVVSYRASDGAELYAMRLGGQSDDVAYDIAADVNGSFYVTGCYRKSADFNGLSATTGSASGGAGLDTPEAFLLKLNGTLGPQWLASTRQQGSGADSTGMAEAHGVAVDSTGCNVYATGRYVGNTDFNPGTATDWLTEGVSGFCPNYRAFVWAFDRDGNYGWTDSFGDVGVNSGNAVAVQGSGLFSRLSCTGYYDEKNSCSSTFSGDLFLRRK